MGDDLRNAPEGWKEELDRGNAAAEAAAKALVAALDASGFGKESPPEPVRSAAPMRGRTGVPQIDAALNRLYSHVHGLGKVLTQEVSHDCYLREFIQKHHYRVTVYPNGYIGVLRDGRRQVVLSEYGIAAAVAVITDLIRYFK